MAAPMWRMNGLWRRMAGVLVLCALLLSNEVMCQEASDATDLPAAAPTADATAVTDAAGDAAALDTTAAPNAGSVPAVSVSAESAPPAAPGQNSFDHANTVNTVSNLDNQDGGTSGTTAAPTVGAASDKVPYVPPIIIKKVMPDVKCVEKEDIQQSNALTAVVVTNDCEASKRIIQENPAEWKCHTEECNLEIFQNGDTMLVTSKNAKLSSLAEALQSEPLKDKLGAKKIEIPSSSGSSVFVGTLVSGLLAALAITAGYFKCQRRHQDTKGLRLAEEACTGDQENQGNTLVSVAPLNPPPETQEKPSVNGESTEAAKTQPPPPTNGHSTTKTADTEL